MGQVEMGWGMSKLLVQVGMKLSISERDGASRSLLDKSERGQRCRNGVGQVGSWWGMTERGGGSWKLVE